MTGYEERMIASIWRHCDDEDADGFGKWAISVCDFPLIHMADCVVWVSTNDG